MSVNQLPLVLTVKNDYITQQNGQLLLEKGQKVSVNEYNFSIWKSRFEYNSERKDLTGVKINEVQGCIFDLDMFEEYGEQKRIRIY